MTWKRRSPRRPRCRKWYDCRTTSVTEKAKVQEVVRQSFEHARKAAEGLSDADLAREIKLFGQDRGGLTLGLIAIGFAALTGLLAVPGGPGAANVLFAAAAAATSAAIVRMIACQAVLFTILACFATTCVAAASVCVLTAEPLPVIGGGLAAISLAMIEAAANVAPINPW